jgi:hypothetical protein
MHDLVQLVEFGLKLVADFNSPSRHKNIPIMPYEA